MLEPKHAGTPRDKDHGLWERARFAFFPLGAASNRTTYMVRFLGMATTKITITLQDDQVEEIRAHVAAGRAASVSSFVKHAVGVALFDAARWSQMLKDALRQTGGPLTKKERAWADALLSTEGQSFQKLSRC